MISDSGRGLERLAIAPTARSGERFEPSERTGRLAAIDVGSNSIHMIVVEPGPQGSYRVLGREREMVRLGRSAFGDRRALSAEAIRDGLEALAKMTTLAALRGADRVVAVATSAVREAENGSEFLAELRARTGLEVELLSGEEEGALIYRAVREVVDLGPGRAAIVDVGGGSTEWIAVEGGELAGVVSLRLGSLRCAGLLAGDPPGPRTRARLRRAIREQLDGAIAEGRWSRLVATSGTAVCAADLIEHFASGPRPGVRPGLRPERAAKGGLREVRARDLGALVARLERLTREEVAALPAVGPARAESLLAGAILLDELVRRADVERFQVSDRALREGLVLAALGDPIPSGTEAAELRRRQVVRLVERTPSVARHSAQSARLAVRLFDLTMSLHGLGRREREWLEYAALLHDIGYSINYHRHHEHSAYLIRHGALDAFDPAEVEVIAEVARFHRGRRPRRGDPALAGLEPWQRKTVRKLAALLRVADALDRTQASRVEEIYCSIRKKKVTLEVISRFAVDLELEAVAANGRLFESVFDRRLAARQGLEAADG